MDALRSGSRIRLTPILEWLLAVGFLLLILALGSVIVRGLRAVPEPIAASGLVARPLSASMPAAIPERAVSVPVLPFHDGKELRVGESVSEVASTLGRAAETGTQSVDRGALGERLTRFYEYDGARFILVFEPFERNGEARLAAIYLP
jgi:hypothetical protein